MSDKPERRFSVEVNGKRYDIDPMMLTLGERHHMKVEIAKVDGDPDEWDIYGGMIWAFARRDQPDITLVDIMNAVTVGDIVNAAEVASDSPEA